MSPSTGVTEPVWRPRATRLNGEAFLVELEPVCRAAYDLDSVSLEEYHPELREDGSGENLSVDVQSLHILRLIGYEKTLELWMRLDGPGTVLPDEITATSMEIGWHQGGAVRFGAEVLQARNIQVEATSAGDKEKIDIARRALAGSRESLERVQPAALEGSRFKISADYQTVTDKTTGGTVTGYSSAMEAALRVMVAQCPDKANWKKGKHVCDEADALHRERYGTPVDAYATVGELFRVTKERGSGRKKPVAFYKALVRNNGRGSMYWLEVNDD